MIYTKMRNIKQSNRGKCHTIQKEKGTKGNKTLKNIEYTQSGGKRYSFSLKINLKDQVRDKETIFRN